MADKPSSCSSASTTPAAPRWPPRYLHHLRRGRASRSAPPAPSPPTRSTPPPSRRWPRSASTSPPSSPKILTTDAVKASDVVITMGCGDACPFFPGKRYEDWELDDPAGKGVEAVRPIRDEIRRRVESLISELVPTSA